MDQKQYGYIALFRGQRHELYADSLYAAKVAAIQHFKPRKSQQHEVSVHLAEVDGGTVTHTAVD